jgi:ketosteroid isomerase-like protein
MAAINAHDERKIAELCAEDVTYWEANLPTPIRGRQAVEAHFRENWKTFPDASIRSLNRIVSGDWVADESEWSGTHKGPIQAPGQPPIPATNRRASGKAVAIAHVQGGKVKTMNIYYDNMAFMAQLGLMPGSPP